MNFSPQYFRSTNCKWMTELVTTKTKSTSLSARVEAERKKIAALEDKISRLQQQEVERIGKLAESAGCLDIEITDADYKAAFEALVAAKQMSTAGNDQASNDATNSSRAHG